MKNILCSWLAIAFLSTSVLAQNIQWVDEGAWWTYNAYNMLSSGYITIQNQGDTIVAGQNCKKLSSTYTYSLQDGSNGNGESLLGNQYTNAENDSVFYFKNGTWQKIYDFSMNVGTTYLVNFGAPCEGETSLTVLSTGTEEINGLNLNFLELSIDGDSPW